MKIKHLLCLIALCLLWLPGKAQQLSVMTLRNGASVYIWEDKSKPDVFGMVAFKVGSVDDPVQYTGLAHYLEHVMFKGTQTIDALDWEKEKPIYEKIIAKYDERAATTDQAKRDAIDLEINKLTREAAQYAAGNEFSQLIDHMGGEGLNASTGFDQTEYHNSFPPSQLEKWLEVYSERLIDPVFRGFQTELEAVYEEYNMSLTRDDEKAYYGVLSMLYPNHPSGRHSVLGYQDHLKNPSITNIKNYYATYYVPNNMAICLSGDFDPDEMIATIDHYFGDMKANPTLPEFKAPAEEPIKEIRTKTVYGNEAEFIYVAWPYGGVGTHDAEVADIASSILYNGKCGLLDLDVNQQQKVQMAAAYSDTGVDYGGMWFLGYPKQGQTLDEVKQIMLDEVAKLRSGDFDEGLIAASIANYKRNQMRRLDSNSGRAQAYVRSFINGTDWAYDVAVVDGL